MINTLVPATKAQLIQALETRFFCNSKGEEIHILEGRYRTNSGLIVQLSSLNRAVLNAIFNQSYRPCRTDRYDRSA